MSLLLFGHRGAAGEAPENTLAGFAHAYEMALVRCFEFDVRLTKDEHLAVIHDQTIDRTTNGTGKVCDYTLSELQQYDASVLSAHYPKRAYIPSLEEVLNRYARSIINFQIEIKPDASEKIELVASQVISAIDRFDIADKTVVTSFDPYALECIHRHCKNQKCGLISFDYTLDVLETAISLDCYNACIPLTTVNGKELIEIAHGKGLQTTGWLGNSHEDIDTLLSWGVLSITTNYPTRIRRYLTEVAQVEVL